MERSSIFLYRFRHSAMGGQNPLARRVDPLGPAPIRTFGGPIGPVKIVLAIVALVIFAALAVLTLAALFFGAVVLAVVVACVLGWFYVRGLGRRLLKGNEGRQNVRVRSPSAEHRDTTIINAEPADRPPNDLF